MSTQSSVDVAFDVTMTASETKRWLLDSEFKELASILTGFNGRTLGVVELADLLDVLADTKREDLKCVAERLYHTIHNPGPESEPMARVCLISDAHPNVGQTRS